MPDPLQILTSIYISTFFVAFAVACHQEVPESGAKETNKAPLGTKTVPQGNQTRSHLGQKWCHERPKGHQKGAMRVPMGTEVVPKTSQKRWQHSFPSTGQPNGDLSIELSVVWRVNRFWACLWRAVRWYVYYKILCT